MTLPDTAERCQAGRGQENLVPDNHRIVRSEQAPVIGAQLQPPHRFTRFAVDQLDFRLIAVGVVFFTPLPQGDKQREEIAAFFGQHIFIVGAAIGAGRDGENVMGNEIAQPRRQNILGQAKTSLKFPKTPRSLKRVAYYQQ